MAAEAQIRTELQLFVLNAARDKVGDLTALDDYVVNIALCESLNQVASAVAASRYKQLVRWTASSSWSLVRSILERVDEEDFEGSPQLLAAKVLLGVDVRDNGKTVVPGRNGMTLSQLRSSDRRLRNLSLERHLDLRKAFVVGLFPRLNEFTAIRANRPAATQIGAHLAVAIKHELENSDLLQYGRNPVDSSPTRQGTADHLHDDLPLIEQKTALREFSNDSDGRSSDQGLGKWTALESAAQGSARQLLWHLEEFGVVLLAFHLAVSDTYVPRDLKDGFYRGIRSRNDLIHKALFEYVNVDFYGVELVRSSSGRRLLADLSIPTHLEVLVDFALTDEQRSSARAALAEDSHLEPRTLLGVLARDTEAKPVMDAWRDALTVDGKYFDPDPDADESNVYGIPMRWGTAVQLESVRKAFLLNLSDVIITLRDTGIASGHTEQWMYRRLRHVWDTLANADQLLSNDEHWPPSFHKVLESGTHGIVFDIKWADQWQSFRGSDYDETQRTFWDELISPSFRKQTIATKQWLAEYDEKSLSDPHFLSVNRDHILRESDGDWLQQYGDPTLLDEYPAPEEQSPTSDLPPLFTN